MFTLFLYTVAIWRKKSCKYGLFTLLIHTVVIWQKKVTKLQHHCHPWMYDRIERQNRIPFANFAAIFSHFLFCDFFHDLFAIFLRLIFEEFFWRTFFTGKLLVKIRKIFWIIFPGNFFFAKSKFFLGLTSSLGSIYNACKVSSNSV